MHFYSQMRVNVCSQTQHPLRKNPSFKVNLHTSEDQNHSVQYLHNVKYIKLGHEPYIVLYAKNLDSCSESQMDIAWSDQRWKLD
jgi:hypothetical protein